MNSMKRILLFLLLCLSISVTAQVSRTTEFDFSKPASLQPAVNPTPVINGSVEITDYLFTEDDLSVKFTKTDIDARGVRCATYKNDAGFYYRLNIYPYCTMTILCPTDATIDGIYFSLSSTRGGLYMKDESTYGDLSNYDGQYAFYWENNTGKTVNQLTLATDGTYATIEKMIVKYTMPSAVLVPTPSIESGATVAAFEKLDLVFDNTMSIVSTEGITLS